MSDKYAAVDAANHDDVRLFQADYKGFSRNDHADDEGDPMILLNQKFKVNRKVCDRAGLMSIENYKTVGLNEKHTGFGQKTQGLDVQRLRSHTFHQNNQEKNQPII